MLKQNYMRAGICKESEVSGMEIGREFNKIIHMKVFSEISNAMTSLCSDLLHTDDETANQVLDDMTDKAKKAINCYIDEQKAVFLKIRDCL
jgi:hypothetical protein